MGMLALKMGGHEPRNVAGLQKLEKARKQNLSWSLQGRTQPGA